MQLLSQSCLVALCSSVALWGATSVSVGETSAQDRELQPQSAFAGIADRDARSRALFAEAAKVITSPRCMNCHPASDLPLQGQDQHSHFPPAFRGENGGGVPGNYCSACHFEENTPVQVGGQAPYQSIPGHPRWGLAPIEMAWEGKSIGEICRQLKDRNRNGGRDLAMLHEHLAHDDLVAWGWKPGPGREPAPGSQDQLGELIKAWIDTGAQCP
jgi:hypothetical protein